MMSHLSQVRPNMLQEHGSERVVPLSQAPLSYSGAPVSIPVLTGLCRAAELLLLVIATMAPVGLQAMLPAHLSGPMHGGQLFVAFAVATAVTCKLTRQMNLHAMPALLDPLTQLRPLAAAVTTGALTATIALSLMRGSPPDASILLKAFVWMLTSTVGLLAFRSVVGGVLQRRAAQGRLSTRVALVGADELTLKLMQDAAHQSAITLVGVFDDRQTRLPDKIAHFTQPGSIRELIALAQHEQVDAIVLTIPSDAVDRIARLRVQLSGIAADVYLAVDAASLAAPAVQHTKLGCWSVITVSIRPLKDWRAFKKTMFDRIASALALVTIAPLMAVIAAIVRFDSPGPVMFRQDREGLNGLPFTMYKFRTMVSRTANDEWVQATVNDRRFTRSGQWLRRFSLDELPQLWNVLRGDMSLVGPRPHLATTRVGDRLFQDIVPHYQARHRMKPGLTGWAQVQGLRGETRTEQEITRRVAQDLYYIDNWSLTLDLRIILRTILCEIVSRSGRAH